LKQKFFRVLRITGIVSVIGLFLLLCGTVYVFCSAPKLSQMKLQDLDQSLMLYDKDSSLITSMDGGEDRVLCDIETLSTDTLHAFIAAEDVRFYSHHGIDLRRIVGALLANIKSGGYSEGASTITQQLVKLTHLTSEKTIKRKLHEIVLALQLERQYEKDEILEMYLNTVYFGGGYYGIEAAAKGYFGISAGDLSPWQAATLAAVLKAPSAYAPHINAQACRTRRDLILNIMAEEGFLSTEETILQKAQNLTVLDQSQRENEYGWYVDEVLLEASEKLNVELSELYTGGYRIHTCLDSKLQDAMEELFADESIYPPAAPNGELCQSAAVVMDSVGGIAAIIGGRTYEGALAFNRATEALRQPGSLIKPFASYAPALEIGGYSSASFIRDEPTDFDGYAPQNYGGQFQGLMLLCDALAQSQNVPAVKLLDEVGVNVGYAYALRAGFPLREEDRVLSLALGGISQGVSPLDVCSAYAALAAEGIYHAPYTIRYITDKDGNILYEHTPQTHFFISKESAYELSCMLAHTVKTGTAAELSKLPVILAAKTGTVDFSSIGNSDIWAAAYNSQYAAVVWMGMNETNSNSYIPSVATGGRQPARVLGKIFSVIYPEGSDAWFEQPGGIEAITLDLTSSYLAAMPLLASEHTPQNDRLTLYVKRENVPMDVGTYWSPPAPPTDVQVQFDIFGVPVIRFSMQTEHACYELWRQDASGDSRLGVFDGTHGNVTYYDVTAPSGTALVYRVRAVHKASSAEGEFSSPIRTMRSTGLQLFGTTMPQGG